MAQRISFFGLAAVVALVLYRADNVAPASPPPEMPAGDAQTVELMKNLASDSFAVREAAQKQLDQMPRQMRDTLAQIARETRDAELQSRLLARVNQMDDDAVIDPPHISLDMENAKLDDVARALTNAGVSAGAMNPHLNGSYSVHARQQTLWELLDDLYKQEPFYVERGIRLAGRQEKHPDATGTQNYFGVRAAITPLYGGETAFMLHFDSLFDPRIETIAVGIPEFVRIVDDRGNDLLKGSKYLENMHDFLDRTLQVSRPPGQGPVSVSVKVVLPIIVAQEWKEMTIENPDAHVGEEKTVGLASFKIPDMKLQPFGMEIHPMDPETVPQLPRAGYTGVLVVSLVDFSGNKQPIGTFGGNFGGAAVRADMKQPIKMQVKGLAKFRQLQIPFELSNLAIPQKPLGNK